MKMILASTSPRRKMLAEQIGLEFEIVPSDYEEDMTLDMPPDELAKTLAYGKAKDVADRTEEGIVIGMDTFVTFKDKVIGKPKDKEDAIKTLKAFSGQTITVYTGVALIDAKTKKEIKDFEVTEMQFGEMDEQEIKAYVNTGEPLDKAGSYGTQGLAAVFITGLNGCYFNIVGMPLNNLYKNLKKMGVNIFEFKKWRQKE